MTTRELAARQQVRRLQEEVQRWPAGSGERETAQRQVVAAWQDVQAAQAAAIAEARQAQTVGADPWHQQMQERLNGLAATARRA